MTVNEQLRRATDQIREASRTIPIPPPPPRNRWLPNMVRAAVVTALLVLVVVWLMPSGPDQTTGDPTTAENTELVRTWLTGALSGQFDDIAELTYGESGEPQGLAQLAQTIHGYQRQNGEPTVAIAPFEAVGTELSFVCVSITYEGFSISGAMVIRDWPDLGRRIWEFRSGMIGCTSEPPVTTTLPPLVELSEVWHFPTLAIGRYLHASFDFAVSNNRVLVLEGTEAEGMAVLDLNSGSVEWRFAFPASPGTVLGFEGSRIAWATYEQVGVHSADGSLLWEHAFDDERWPSTAAFQDDHLTVALDPTTEGDFRPPLVVQFDRVGAIAWSTELSGANQDEDLQWSSLLIMDGGVIVQTTDATYRLDLATGTQLWRVPFADAEVESFIHTGGTVSDGVVYVADPAGGFSGQEGGEVLGIGLETGDVMLTVGEGRAPRIVGIVDGWLIYTESTGVFGVHVSTGAVWHERTDDVSASLESGRIVVASPSAVGLLSPTGEREAWATTDIGIPQQPPVLLGETVIVPGWEGSYAVDLATGELIKTWAGGFDAPAYKLDEKRALVGIAGDGLYLVAIP